MPLLELGYLNYEFTTPSRHSQQNIVSTNSPKSGLSLVQRLQLEDESLLSPIKAPMVHLSQIIFPFDSDVACSHCMQMKGLALGPMIQLLHAYVVCCIVRPFLGGPTSLLIVF